MGSEQSLSTRLADLEQRWASITDSPAHPRSVMDVIEYGLGDHQRAEVYINRLLRYLLDHEEPHGMDAAFLRVFLEGLPSACGFEEDLYDLSDVVVDEQVPISRADDDEDNSPGYLDLLIHVPEEWFLIVELKFSAPQTGLEFYCSAEELDGRPKSAYESGQYYLYLHQADEPEAAGNCFTNWTWDEFLDDVVAPFVHDHGPRYPTRTTTQLRDLEYDIRQITNMSDHEQSEHEKADLYIEYYDAVSDVSEAFETRWDEFANNWYRRLADRIDDPTLMDNWVFWEYSDDWAYIYKHGWWRRADTFDQIAEPVDPNRVRVGFLHRLDKHRDLALGEHTLKFYFRNTPPNRHTTVDGTNFRDQFIEAFDARREEIRAALPESASLTGNMHNMIEASYGIPVTESEDFYTAYITALHTAFEDHVIANSELVDLLNAAYEDTLDQFV